MQNISLNVYKIVCRDGFRFDAEEWQHGMHDIDQREREEKIITELFYILLLSKKKKGICKCSMTSYFHEYFSNSLSNLFPGRSPMRILW